MYIDRCCINNSISRLEKKTLGTHDQTFMLQCVFAYQDYKVARPELGVHLRCATLVVLVGIYLAFNLDLVEVYSRNWSLL